MVSVDLFEEEDNNVEREKSPLEMMAEKRSQIIFKQRMSVGLTQSELAERANVTQKTVSRMERGDSKVRETTLQKVYEVLGITEKHLETLREQPNT
ncbi:XRE family transcriptional regulator [Rummeliibacillus sp. TYF005]|uniref:helix-turn-helix domain-containing protein n=1 Tax=Rummeliibacillus sp. TYF005 TaxID=2058214 RepID=UPI000F51F50A|nr:helix-turn-helix transcriptional regulator [Rummeliibacillus sp. TYF005]RPJ95106.1 XRE family transcriptional regulator [Rummeliibacillus sp. TYF005]